MEQRQIDWEVREVELEQHQPEERGEVQTGSGEHQPEVSLSHQLQQSLELNRC